MSSIPNRDENSLVNNNSKLIIISKGRIISAKDHINYITLKEGELKLTMELNNNSLNKNDINKAVKNIRSQNIKNSKSNTNLFESNNNLNSKEKKFFKVLYKKKENEKNNQKITNIETTKNNNFMDTSGNNNNKRNIKENIKPIEKIKLKKLNIMIPTGTNEDNKSVENDVIIDDLIINENLGNNLKNSNDIEKKKEDLKIKISDINDTNVDNENEKNNEKNIYLEGNKLSSKDGLLEGKEKIEMKKKLSSQEMSLNNNDLEELKHMYMDSSRSKENTIPFNNNLIEKSNQKTKLSKANLISKSENFSDNNNLLNNEGAVDSAIVNIGDTAKSNYMAQNLITEMEGDEISNKNLDKEKEDLISEDKTIKIDENQEEDASEEKEKNKEEEENNGNIDNDENLDNNLEEKKSNEMIKVNNNNFNNTAKASLLELKQKKRNENTPGENRNIKYRSLNLNNIRTTPVIYNMCQICEHTLPLSRLFSPGCNKHFLCKKCAKIYYEDIIENGTRELCCPLNNCRKPINLEDIKSIISEEHFRMLTKKLDKNQNNLLFAKLKTDTIQETLELYTEKHVLDVDTNKKFFNFNNMKGNYCPNCSKDTLFNKGNTHFLKCLNCEKKICRYCSKSFSNDHLDLNNPTHCKVYYRYTENLEPKTNYCLKYLLELFFVLASFYLSFVGAFLLIKKIFYKIFNMKDNKNCIKYTFQYLFTIICFIIVIPIIFIFFPVYPSLLALFDF